MSQFLPPESLILVAVMPATRDLEIARLLGWYRIRFKSAPKILEVDYVAFYQTGAFGAEHGGRIEHYAELRGHELVRRRDLFREEVEHPRAGEEYFKLMLGPLQTLPQPLPAGKWKRVTFLYTTGELFNRARTVDDLVVRCDARATLWRTMRERALQTGRYHAEDLPEEALDAGLLALLGAFLK